MAAHSFQCPSCGASLLPRGGHSVISCPYCHTSVVVPEPLRRISGADGWSPLLFDNFTSNESNWLVGNYPSQYFATLSQTIAEGRYRWAAEVSLAPTITTAWLASYAVSDFHLTAHTRHISGSREGSSCGIIFRIQDNHNFYWFHVTDSQKYAVSVQREARWLNVVDWSRTSAIKPHGINHLEVIGQGRRFTFLINGQAVSEVEDDHFRQGFVGLAIETYTPGEKTVYDFMDLTLRAP